MNYTPYHVHSEYSLVDSCAPVQSYIDLAVKYGMTALGFSEHGNIFNWTEKLEKCHAAGLKYLHGCEVYLGENIDDRTGYYHTVLIAKNEAGLRELNALISKSNNDIYLYKYYRVMFEDFLNVSDNIICISACLMSPLWKLPMDHPMYEKLLRKYDYLEVQCHDIPDQKEFNKRLIGLSKQYGIPLIVGTDSHYTDEYMRECRELLVEDKWGKVYDHTGIENAFYSYEEIFNLFKKQGVLTDEEITEALENTNRMADQVEDIYLDKKIKYPISYGTAENDEKRLEEMCWSKFQDKLNKGIIPPEQKDAFETAINDELRVFSKLGMGGFMLSMSELTSYIKDSGMYMGPARGSVGGSRVAYVTDIVDLNPETWNTVFSRFCNENRVEAGDIDIDVVKTDRPKIFKYLEEKFGRDKTARVVTFQTLQSKACIKLIGRVLMKRWEKAHPDEPFSPWSYKNVEDISDLFEDHEQQMRKKYPELFYYYDGLLGVKVAKGVHAAGMIVSPISLQDNYGVHLSKDREITINLDMDACHEVQLIKYDLLSLKTVEVIRDTCDLAGIPYPKSHEINWNDEKVWADINSYPNCIFQFEKASAFRLLKKFQASSVSDMALLMAAIRPSAASYRDNLSKRVIHHNPSQMIDDILKDNLGYLVYQEDIITFLQRACGLSGSEADSIRRAIGSFCRPGQ